jgi:hypothetical protein
VRRISRDVIWRKAPDDALNIMSTLFDGSNVRCR